MTTRQSILLAIGILAIFSLMLLILFGDNGLADLSRMRSEKQRIETRNDRLDRENRDLYRKVVRLDGQDPAFIEHVARKDLGMIGKNEVVFKLDSEKDARSSGAP